MQLLDTNSYHIALDAINQVQINNLFAIAVAEQKVEGKIYVDHKQNPKTFLVAHPYGMSLLFGNENNKVFNAAFSDYALNKYKSRPKTERLQAYPTAWNEKLVVLFKNHSINEDDKTANENQGKISWKRIRHLHMYCSDSILY